MEIVEEHVDHNVLQELEQDNNKNNSNSKPGKLNSSKYLHRILKSQWNNLMRAILLINSRVK